MATLPDALLVAALHALIEDDDAATRARTLVALLLAKHPKDARRLRALCEIIMDEVGE